MFKTSAIFAALLLAGGGAASAAEIGVRHSHGTSTRAITQGRFEAETKVREVYAEASAGWGLGGAESSSASRSGEFVQSELPRYATGYENNDSGGFQVGRRGPRGGFSNDRSGYEVVRPTTFVGEESSSSSWQLGGSGYVRGLVGWSRTDVKDSYRYSGTDASSFSELSTFSR